MEQYNGPFSFSIILVGIASSFIWLCREKASTSTSLKKFFGSRLNKIQMSTVSSYLSFFFSFIFTVFHIWLKCLNVRLIFVNLLSNVKATRRHLSVDLKLEKYFLDQNVRSYQYHSQLLDVSNLLCLVSIYINTRKVSFPFLFL